MILRVDSAGKLTEFPLADVNYSVADIPNAPQQDKQRQDVTTDLQFTGGQVLVAGLSNEEFASQLGVIPFPFAAVDKGTSIEIYHGSHGKFETKRRSVRSPFSISPVSRTYSQPTPARRW